MIQVAIAKGEPVQTSFDTDDGAVEVHVQKIEALPLAKGTKPSHLSVKAGNMSIAFPPAVVAMASRLNSNVTLVVSVIKHPISAFKSNGEINKHMAANAVEIELFAVEKGGSSSNVVVRSLEEPIHIELDVVTSAPNLELACVFWDGHKWSIEGMSVGRSPSHVDTKILCHSNHLSLFSAAWIDVASATDECSNVNVLSAEALHTVFEQDGTWSRRLPAALLWLLLTLMVPLLAYAVYKDAQLQRDATWKYFFTNLVVPGERRGSIKCLRCGSGNPSGQQVRMQLLIASIHANLSYELSVSNQTLSSYLWDRDGRVKDAMASNSSLHSKEHLARVRQITAEAYMDYVYGNHLARRLWDHFCHSHAVSWIGLLDIEVTSAKRAKISIDTVLCTLALAALFISVDGTVIDARSPASCSHDSLSLPLYLVIAVVSGLLSTLASILVLYVLRSSFDQKQHATEEVQTTHGTLIDGWTAVDISFWFVSSIFSSVFLLLILALVSTLGQGEEDNWVIMFICVLLLGLVVLPLISACVHVGFACLASFLPDFHDSMSELGCMLGIDVGELSDSTKFINGALTGHTQPDISGENFAAEQQLCEQEVLPTANEELLKSMVDFFHEDDELAQVICDVELQELDQELQADLTAAVKAHDSREGAQHATVIWGAEPQIDQELFMSAIDLYHDEDSIRRETTICGEDFEAEEDEEEFDMDDLTVAIASYFQEDASDEDDVTLRQTAVAGTTRRATWHGA